MNSIHDNPFRVAGILGNSSEKDIQKQKSKITRFTEVGKEVTSEYDFSFLNKITRNTAVIDKAFSDIEQNQSRINHALFWFVNSSPVDATAIEHLISGNKEKAVEIWEKLVTDKEVTSKNFSAFNNVGTLYFLEGTKESLSKGLTSKLKLIESEHFADFAHAVADATFSPNAQKQTEFLVDRIFSENKNTLSPGELNAVFSSNATAKKYASQKVTQEPIRNLETAVEEAKKSRAANKLAAYQTGKNLYTKTKSDLALLVAVVGKTDLQYKMLADNVAKEILQCSIDYFNESQEQNRSNDYLKESMDLAILAKGTALNAVTVERINDNIATLENMKNRELKNAINILLSVKTAYDRACQQIDKQVDELQHTETPFGRMRDFNVSINWSKVEEMKRKALDWNKVIDLVKGTISEDDVIKISTSQKYDQIEKYKSLVDFLLSKLGPIQMNSVKYLCYWKDIKVMQTKVTFENLSTSVGKQTAGKCYIATMAYGDYDHPQVLELRRFRDEVLHKSVLGNWFVDLYYFLSPKLVKVLKNQTAIHTVIRELLNQFIKIIK